MNKISSLWNQFFNLTNFHYSRPSNEIYVACFMYPASFVFRPSIDDKMYALPKLKASLRNTKDHLNYVSHNSKYVFHKVENL